MARRKSSSRRSTRKSRRSSRRSRKTTLLTPTNLVMGGLVLAWFFWPKKATPLTLPTPPAVTPAQVISSQPLVLPTTYVVKPGDSLSKIAQKYYDDPMLWQKIYDANVWMIGTNPDLIEVGARLTIPA